MEIELTPGKTTIFDDEVWPLIASHKWYAALQADGLFYAIAKVWDPVKKKQKKLRMHCLILGNPTGIMIDHRNGDGLINHRWNLRVATYAQNNRNRRKKSNVV